MDKIQLTDALFVWFPKFIKQNFPDQYDLLEIIKAPQQLSRLNNQHIKNLQNYSSWEFKPDLLGILKSKIDSTIKLAFINRTTAGISLKEIGELYCYAKLANANFAFLVSTSGVSNEVNILLVDKSIRTRVLGYDCNKSICLFSWNEEKRNANKDSVLPIEMRNLFN